MPKASFPLLWRALLLLCLACSLPLTTKVGAWAAAPASTKPQKPAKQPQPSNVAQPQPVPTTLSLAGVLAQVQAHHPKLLGAAIEQRIALAKQLEKEGAFDPTFNVESDYLRYNDFSKRGNVSQTWDNDIALNWLSSTGIKLSAGMRYNTGQVKPPLYPTGGGGEYFMGIKVPLLRGFRINEKAMAQQQAKLGVPLAVQALAQTRLELLQKAAAAYWAWVAAQRKLQVATQLLQVAQVRATGIAERLKVGDAPRVDVTEANQEVKRREGLLTKANREVQKEGFKLSAFLWEADGKPSPLPQPSLGTAVLPPTSPMAPEEWMDFRVAAMERRPELKALNIQKEIVAIDAAYAKNLRLPILDVYASPGWDTGRQSIGPTLKAGVNLVVPLATRTAKGLLQAAQFKLQKLDLDQRQLLQTVLLGVDDAFSALSAAHQQVEAAKQEYELATQLEKDEQERFAFGDSTLFLLNQRERQAAETVWRLIDLEADYWQSYATLQAASGTL